MSDDKSHKAPHDTSRINVNEEYEVRYWSKELGVSEGRLRQLVRENGPSTAAVRHALGD